MDYLIAKVKELSTYDVPTDVIDNLVRELKEYDTDKNKVVNIYRRKINVLQHTLTSLNEN